APAGRRRPARAAVARDLRPAYRRIEGTASATWRYGAASGRRAERVARAGPRPWTPLAPGPIVRAVRPSRLARGLAGLLAVLAGCQGRGSDIGPKLGAKPPDPFQVQVFDDQGRPVCGATVRFGDASAVTGRAGRSESPVRPRGLTRFTIDASAASATDLDDLAGFAYTAEPIDDGRALPRA